MIPDVKVLWTGAAMVVIGAAATSGVIPQQYPSLRAPLQQVTPERIGPYASRDVEVSEAEQQVAGFDDYLMRVYEPDVADGQEQGATTGTAENAEEVLLGSAFSLYVGFYDSQTRGRTIHSPKNCMPGSGWQALESRMIPVTLPGGETVEVNRYLLQREDEQALVLYWYQGRGRVVANEYRAKWDLLRDAALERRSDEALVRIVVPVTERQDAAQELAVNVARTVLPALDRALPS